MNVLQMMTTASTDGVIAAYKKHFDHDLSIEQFRESLAYFRSRVLIKTVGVVCVDHYREVYSDPSYDNEAYHVVWLAEDGEEYALAFNNNWGEILAAEVRCGADLTLEEQVAIIYDDLTELGLTEETQFFQDELLDMVEQIERGEIEATPIDVNALLGDDGTPEGRAKVEALREIFGSIKTYKNGVLVEREAPE